MNKPATPYVGTPFARKWQRLDRLRDPRAFGSWLRRLAVRLFIDARRLKHTDLEELSGDDFATASASPDRIAGAELDLERALTQLSPAERICIVLNLGEGLSHGEIEQATAIPLGTVKSHILRGTTKLRRTSGAGNE